MFEECVSVVPCFIGSLIVVFSEMLLSYSLEDLICVD